MIKEIIGMLKWKRTMKKYAGMKPYSDEWWDIMTNSLAMLPEEQRQGIMDNIIQMGAAL